MARVLMFDSPRRSNEAVLALTDEFGTDFRVTGPLCSLRDVLGFERPEVVIIDPFEMRGSHKEHARQAIAWCKGQGRKVILGHSIWSGKDLELEPGRDYDAELRKPYDHTALINTIGEYLL